MLPKNILKVKVPPLKIQGIKTKLVPFIAESVIWDGKGTYFEPFMGSGVVGFNLAPQKAVFSDTNPYIIQFYQDIQSGKVTSKLVRAYLEEEAPKLAATPVNSDSYYYEVRNRFNETHNSLDFLFLQRSNFNGMMRFNSKGGYNVPFGRKPERFQKALITKICNQVLWVEELLRDKDWKFKKMSFVDAFKMMDTGDFVYLDPPYINRYDGYYDTWNEDYANLLAELTQNGKAGYAFSMWYQNEYRKNNHMEKWSKGTLLTTEHFYHLGAKEINRNSMLEALVVSDNNVNKLLKNNNYYQETLF
ncbi:DNA adenine methylase [Enterococcus faecium]|uniref:DNA adenine methylase n=1 Tax=Enterococcus faecium TaxID=1352 RepID=UPI000CF29490|nr:Dam family site-specific DNA-(adenine-N6)-methyltransferase [Enterococcus faecium]EMF0118452.1 Dam family site-specific DNA-(adenine-N6)-methyltransferase [Enterococcus hirae]EGP4912651.1 Dam family site-specific DNA-(adenine-N6)-methyltransferase [Enterococcus faecium]EME8243945.1 Dam family site-specific DNA-(adenine-N6)-methyltransferase [Enterococcus faecium]MDQ8458011.1 Dam family site-specific DNA-(adenine-N6)-methyltransferase [Enterococcus faecium]PQF76073.1 DNA adenine methylase [E